MSTLTDIDIEPTDSPDDAASVVAVVIVVVVVAAAAAASSAQVTDSGHPHTPPTPTPPSYINAPGQTVVLLTLPAEQYTYDRHCVPSFNE